MKKNNFKIFISVAVCMLFVLSLWVYFLKLNFVEIDKKANQKKDFFWRDFFSFDIKLEENQKIKDSFTELNDMLNSTSTPTTTLDILGGDLSQEKNKQTESGGEVLGVSDKKEKVLDEELKNKLLDKVKEIIHQKNNK